MANLTEKFTARIELQELCCARSVRRFVLPREDTKMCRFEFTGNPGNFAEYKSDGEAEITWHDFS
jgi:hypothetical protein